MFVKQYSFKYFLILQFRSYLLISYKEPPPPLITPSRVFQTLILQLHSFHGIANRRSRYQGMPRLHQGCGYIQFLVLFAFPWELTNIPILISLLSQLLLISRPSDKKYKPSKQVARSKSTLLFQPGQSLTAWRCGELSLQIWGNPCVSLSWCTS